MSPTLVILAAGLGSRYGGLKQMEPLGPHGETLLEYSIYDAHRAGFHHIVFIVRKEFADAFKMRMQQSPAVRGMDLRYVMQEIRDLPAGFLPPISRDKPWGTTHAVWSARQVVHTPFAVVNADDFYGADAFRQLAGFLAAANPQAPDFALVGYQLGQTLSEHGAVARGICRVNADGLLASIEERTGLERDAATGGARGTKPDGSAVQYPADTLVSMNCWGLTPAAFPLLESQLNAFLRLKVSDLKSECYLPTAIGNGVTAGRARVHVLPTAARWCGVTYQQDRPAVQAALLALHEAGEYPNSFS